jgi:hypothetical protein
MNNTSTRYAIRHGDVLLSVPAMHPATPRSVRIEILELVLRRQWGEAHDLAKSTADALDGREPLLAKMRSLMGPSKNSWELGAAA